MALLFILVTLGAFVTSLTGLGGGTLILAGLMLVYPPEVAIPLHSFTLLTANAVRVGVFHRTVHWKVVGAYFFFMIPSAWIAASIFDYINPSWLKIMVGALILFSVIPFKFKPKDEPSYKTFLGLGIFSGFVSVFVGSVGPMMTPYFNRLKISRDGMISTKSAGQMLLQVSKIVAFTGASVINFSELKDRIVVLVVASLLGVAVSVPISRKISDDKFNLGVDILLGLISLKVLYEGFSELYRFYF